MEGSSRSLFKKVFTVGGWTGISRVLGLVRQVLHAGVFGTSAIQSAFVIAWQIPNLFRRLFGEGALSQAFVPVFTATAQKEGRDAAERLANRLLTLLAIFLGAVAAIGIALLFAVQPFVSAASHWHGALPLLRILLPYAPVICMAAITMGVLQALEEFRFPAAAPCLLNLVWIAVLAGVLPFLDLPAESRIRLLSWALLAAGFLQFGFLAAALRHRGFRLRPDFRFGADPLLREVCRNAGPAILGNAVLQLNTLLDNVIAMLLAAPWAPSCLSYAILFYDLPIGLVSTAFSTVLLPTLSKSIAGNDPEGTRRTFAQALSGLLAINLPATVALILLARPIIALFYQHGAFDAASTARTALALAFYAAGLPFVGLQKAAVALFNARKDTVTPMRVSLLCVAVNLSLNLLFVLTWAPEWKHAGIAFSTTLSMALNATLLFAGLRRRQIAPALRPVLATALRALAASAAMGIALALLPARIAPALPVFHGLDLPLAFGLAFRALAGLAVYAAALSLLTPGGPRAVLKGFRSHGPA